MISREDKINQLKAMAAGKPFALGVVKFSYGPEKPVGPGIHEPLTEEEKAAWLATQKKPRNSLFLGYGPQ